MRIGAHAMGMRVGGLVAARLLGMDRSMWHGDASVEAGAGAAWHACCHEVISEWHMLWWFKSCVQP
eukprot:352785-Chlamydomonas_euryale.AAC.8